MAIVREAGAPNMFITMTCNPNWPEIKENLRPGEKASDRPDIVARVFMQKLKTLNKDLDEGLLGIVATRIHVIQKAELIRKASLIIWDEAPMMHRACFEAVDRSFRDIMKNELEPFGGKVMVFSGDHRQILPVLKDATRAETLEVCFKSSPLWSHLRQVRLTENMRIQTAPGPASAAELAEFSDFLLQIGKGARADDRWDGEETKENENMEAPPNFNLLPPTETSSDRGVDNPDEDRQKQNVNALIDAVYPGVVDDNLPDEYSVERAILAPTNASVRRINDMVSERLSGETKEYLSVDSLEGPFKGKRVFIPRIIFYNEDDDKEFPFKHRRKQFPVVPAFAITINKA
ncbi:Helitron helicase-like protein [Phytophthora palmivora]|uniref:ATP-dependent DNA helicase n=1 Tax=Phytophthora palmivora TaxID=4796 RepID=A0A2P4X476_9STRA|nr:Helitron helicase-like protein [Phytophthora palmivora]